MANKTYDGVIEAVHYSAGGKVEWVRVYMRRGPSWSDRIILQRQELIEAIRSGKRMMLGKRVEFMAGTFEVTDEVRLAGMDGTEWLVVSADAAAYGPQEQDNLEGAPLL
jgi:hypothetical protein